MVHIELKADCSYLRKTYYYIFTKKCNYMSNLHNTYTRILSLLHELEPRDNFLNQRHIPKFSDKCLLALSLAAESLGIDSERYLFKRLPKQITDLIERSVYNRRRRRLLPNLDALRQAMACKVIPREDYHIVDSMPLEICKFSRAKRSKVCQQVEETSPDYGYCASQNTTYFGYKLHAVCTIQGVIKSVDLSRASAHDIHYLDDVKSHFTNCILIGDRGYLRSQYQHDLFETSAITLETPLRKNQLDFKPFSPELRKARKRIETLFSQLCDQFMIRRNYAKSFPGLSVRVLSKITALTLIQWVNMKNGNNINNLKIVIN